MVNFYQVKFFIADTELNYFVFETHVRKLIRDLIEPTQQKASEDREHVNEVKRILNSVSKRIYELEYIIYKGSERNTIFDDIYNKMNQMVVDHNLLNERLKEESFKFMKRHEIVEDQLKAIEITQNTVGDHIRNFQNDIDKFYETLHQTKKDLTEVIYNNKQRADADASNINQQIIKIQTTMKINQHEFEAASGKITKLEKEKDRHQERLEQLAKEIYEIQEIKLDKTQFNMDTKRIENQFQQIDFALGDLNNNIIGTDNYIEKYLPFKSLQLVVESMSQILDKKQVKRLTDFEQKKYKELHQGILSDDGNPKNEKASYLNQFNSAEKTQSVRGVSTGMRRNTSYYKLNEELYARSGSGTMQNHNQIHKMGSNISQTNGTQKNFNSNAKSQFNNNIYIDNGNTLGDSKNSIDSKDDQIINNEANSKDISIVQVDQDKNRNINQGGYTVQRNTQMNAMMSQDTYLSLRTQFQEQNIPPVSPREGSLRHNTSQNQIGMSLIGLNDLDPILLNKIRSYDEDMPEMKQDIESIKKLIMDVKGLNRSEIDKEFRKLREELKQATKEILSYCEAFQSEFEKEQEFRKRDKMNWQLEIENLNKEVQRLNSYCIDKLFKPLNNLQDMTIVIMENSLIEQAVALHTLLYCDPTFNQEQQLDSNNQNNGNNPTQKQEKQYDYEIQLPGQHLLKQQNHQQLPLKNFELAANSNNQGQSQNQTDYVGIHNVSSARRQDAIKTSYQNHRKLLSSSQTSMAGKGAKQTNSLYQLRAETPQQFQISGTNPANSFIKRKQSKTPFSNYHSNQSSSSNLFAIPTASVIGGSTFASSNNNFNKQQQVEEMPLQYRNKLFKRDQLIMVRGYLLQQAWSIYSSQISDPQIKANNVQMTSQLFKQALRELSIEVIPAGPNRKSNKQSMNRLKDINAQYETQTQMKPSNLQAQNSISNGQGQNSQGLGIYGQNPQINLIRPQIDNFSPLQTPAYQDQVIIHNDQKTFEQSTIEHQKLNQNSSVLQ